MTTTTIATPSTVAQPIAPTIDYAAPSLASASPRLVSLDVFRGLVILAMLVVNNVGDASTTGYFWRHADWPAVRFIRAWEVWWAAVSGQPEPLDFAKVQVGKPPPRPSDQNGLTEWMRVQYRLRQEDAKRQARAKIDTTALMRSPWSHLPLFTYCTLADYVMPCFMLIIGAAIPFSVAAAHARGVMPRAMWLRTIRRAATLVLLGWVLCYFRDQFANSLHGNVPWTFTFGMDVLQLLGVSYLLARILYELPPRRRAIGAAILLIGHWAILRFYPQGVAPSGTFTERYNAISYIYEHWPLWDWLTLHAGPVTVGWRGLMSVPPAAGTMLIGTLVGDVLRAETIEPRRKVSRLLRWGAALAVIGLVWAFDLPFNKPRWTPCYLVYVSGVGTMLLAGLYWLLDARDARDVRHVRRWTYPLVVFGVNAIALYFLSILFKVLLLNTPHVHTRDGQLVPLIEVVLSTLKHALGAWAGGWTFTILFVGLWWVVMEQLYRRRIVWKV